MTDSEKLLELWDFFAYSAMILGGIGGAVVGVAWIVWIRKGLRDLEEVFRL